MNSTSSLGRVSAGRAARTLRIAGRRIRRGFTLIEMMVVVAIIATLAVILIPNFLHSKQASDVSASESNLKEIATAVELYNNDNQAYPANGNVTPALFNGGANPSTYYLQTTPTSPGTGGGDYVYATDGNGDYTITDPATYQKGTLLNVEKATAAGGVATDSGAKCTNACTKLGYSNQVGNFGN